MKCRLCNTEITQGESGYEIGIMKWFNNIQPFPFIALVCRKHYLEIARILGIAEWEGQPIQDQKDERREK